MVKKQTYAQKHSNFINNEDADIYALFKNPYAFETNFSNLPYWRQIAAISVFNSIRRGKFNYHGNISQQDLSYMATQFMEMINWMTCSSYEEGNIYSPLSSDEKKLIRMESYGSIDKRREHELSAFYKFFCQNKNRGNFSLKEYNLKKSPSWRVFAQFASFRHIESKIKIFLRQQGINPDALQVMTVNDFCDIIYKTFQSSANAPSAAFMKRGYKNSFVMRFMQKCGQDLERHLVQRGIDGRAAHSLCRTMRKYGLCDPNVVTITEIHFTKRILKDLRSAGISVKKFKIGDTIPEKFIEKMFALNLQHLLLARNKKGMPLDKSRLPRFEVHHKNAVKFSADGEYLAKANYDSNLMLVESNMHAVYYHGSDSIVRIDADNKSYCSRINVNASELCFIDGFDITNDAFFCDLADNPQMKMREKQDSKHVINYYQMQLERLNNIPKIAEKYKLHYSKNAQTTEINNLKKLISVNIEIPNDDLKVIKRWIKQQGNKK